MRKFFVFTVGRTGSTAIADEINNHPAIICESELFYRNSTIKSSKIIDFDSLPYTEERIRSLPVIYPYKAYLELIAAKKLWKTPLFNVSGKVISERKLLRRYFDYIEGKAESDSIEVFGFKVLGNHCFENPGLIREFCRRGYKAIILIRRNIVRTVISSHIATQRGKFNAKNYEIDNCKYQLDLNSLRHDLINIDGFQKSLSKTLSKFSIPFMTVYYEDFVNDRNGFYSDVFGYLGVELVEPARTEYSKMTPTALDDVVENYNELIDMLDGLGMSHYLDCI